MQPLAKVPYSHCRLILTDAELWPTPTEPANRSLQLFESMTLPTRVDLHGPRMIPCQRLGIKLHSSTSSASMSVVNNIWTIWESGGSVRICSIPRETVTVEYKSGLSCISWRRVQPIGAHGGYSNEWGWVWYFAFLDTTAVHGLIWKVGLPGLAQHSVWPTGCSRSNRPCCTSYPC